MAAQTLSGDDDGVNDAHVVRHGVTAGRAPCTTTDPDDGTG